MLIVIGVEPEHEMGSLLKHYAQCRRTMCRAAKRRKTITYGELATALGLPSARQQWSTVLNPICKSEKKNNYADLTLIVVYKTGRAKGLSRYFSQKSPPQTRLLDPLNRRQVAAYRRQLEKVFDIYARVPC